MNRALALALVTTLLIALASPVATATEDEEAGFDVQYNRATHEVELSWPPYAGAYVYAVYRDGLLLETTTATAFTETLHPDPDTGTITAAYVVTAIEEATPPNAHPPCMELMPMSTPCYSQQSATSSSSQFQHVLGGALLHHYTSGPMDGVGCELIITKFTPNSYPYVHAGINHACLPWRAVAFEEAVDGPVTIR